MRTSLPHDAAFRAVSLPEVVGRGYGTFWRSRARYVVVKGSRASKKSTTTALWLITKIMEHPLANAIVIRKTYRTMKDSCFRQLKWAINRLGVSEWWHATESPLELTYKPTGQKILFRGLDDPLKVTSVTVDVGYLCWGWVEEAYEITSEADFDTIDESIRGELPPDLWKQWRITFNPWNERHWMKARFFDAESSDVLAMTTDYRCNEWLDETDLKLFEDMKRRNPRRYRVAGLGDWGITEGLVYENWQEQAYQIEDEKADGFVDTRQMQPFAGLDFGYTTDPTAFVVGFFDKTEGVLYIYDEIYERALSNVNISERIKAAGYGKARITADSAEPKSIDELKSYGLRVSGARKGKDSVMNGIQWVQNQKIVIHPRCVNFITEVSNYTWETDRFGVKTGKPVDDFNHALDALRYGCEQFIGRKGWMF